LTGDLNETIQHNEDMEYKIKHLDELLRGYKQAWPARQWTEDRGDVLWWQFPISEPPYIGTPNDTDYPIVFQKYPNFTYFTTLIIPTEVI
jgi:hypothetical protein